MRIVADERIAALDDTFGRHGTLTRLDGHAIGRAHLENADALLTRTVTRVDSALLEGTPVRFVGTATIGTDHLDRDWLEAAGIRWAAAPGCNADATAQHTLAMYALACRRLERDPFAQRFGIVGRGNVGGRLMRMLERLGIACIACDPPLEAQGERGLVAMDQILECDVVSLHVPLTRGGRWPTYRMFDQALFRRLGQGALLINACRGDVVEDPALVQWLGRGGQAALDVWPGEPEIDTATLEKVVVGTPHIAGYSLDGKHRASAMIYRAFCECFGFDPGHTLNAGLNAGPQAPSTPPPPKLNMQDPSFMKQLLQACPVERDDTAMRALLESPAGERAAAFEDLRANYPLRRDLLLDVSP